MLTYTEVKTIFSKAHNKALGARLTGCFMRLMQIGNDFGIRYHDRVVVAINADGTYTLNNEEYFTGRGKKYTEGVRAGKRGYNG
jgi:hypothetical protein